MTCDLNIVTVITLEVNDSVAQANETRVKRKARQEVIASEQEKLKEIRAIEAKKESRLKDALQKEVQTLALKSAVTNSVHTATS